MRLFVEACLRAPVGVALLAMLEKRHREDVAFFRAPPDSNSAAVEAAVASVGSMGFGELCSIAVDAGESFAGPWGSAAPEQVAVSYRCAEERRPIAEAIADRFDRELHTPMDPGCQEWWTSAGYPARRLFDEFDKVYSNGSFTWAGLWTTTAPPPETHDELINRWEIFPGPVSRWRLPVLERARVREISRPSDWLDLVLEFPKLYEGPNDAWELPGPNRATVSRLFDVPNQRAAVAESKGRLMPDWRAVAQAIDGVHLTWAGFITTEGFVREAGDGRHTMVRHWGSERTLWLSDVFGEPEPLPAPNLSGRINEVTGISVSRDETRREEDRRLLMDLLGR